MVGVIVTASMHHQAATRDILAGETRSEHGVGGRSVGRNIERWQITKMTVSPRQPVVTRALRVVVRSGGTPRHHGAILLGGSAARPLVHVKTVQPGRQSLEARREHEAVRRFAEYD